MNGSSCNLANGRKSIVAQTPVTRRLIFQLKGNGYKVESSEPRNRSPPAVKMEARVQIET